MFLFLPPIFLEYTATSTTSSSPEFNVTDTGVDVNIGVTSGLSTSSSSPFRKNDRDIMFGDDLGNFQDFVFSPFTVNQASDDDEALITKGQFKQLNDKLD